MVSLRLEHLTVRLGDSTVLRDLDLHVESGSSLAVLGQSGSGKSTLLRTIAGLEHPIAGGVYLDNIDITDLPASGRGVVFVAQTPALQPNLDLAGNVERPLKWVEDQPAASRRRRVFNELRRFGLAGRGHKSVREASAGEKHSAATARGTIRNPEVLLLDEPVIALDPPARRDRIRQLRRQHHATESTLIVATNDWTVAAGLAERVAVLADGHIAQVDEPTALYDNPVSIHVAELTGAWQLNRLAGTLLEIPGAQREIITPAGPIRTWRHPPDRQMMVGIRSADLTVDDEGDLRGVVESSAVLGATSLVTVDADGLRLQAMGPMPPPAPGSSVRLAWRRAHLFTFNGDAIDHFDSVRTSA